MITDSKIREIYTQIQKQLFYMIPEKWDKVYLYSSILERPNHMETGELYFYYVPKGVLKKNPVNVYEIMSDYLADSTVKRRISNVRLLVDSLVGLSDNKVTYDINIKWA